MREAPLLQLICTGRCNPKQGFVRTMLTISTSGQDQSFNIDVSLLKCNAHLRPGGLAVLSIYDLYLDGD
jgi:hypothetical protein